MADIASPSSRPVYGTVRFWLFGLCNGALLEAVLDEGLRHLWPLMLLLYVVSVMILIPNGKRSARASDTGEPADSPGQRTFGDLGVLCGIGAGICLFWLALGADGRVPWGFTWFVLGSLGIFLLHFARSSVPVRFPAQVALASLIASLFGIAFYSGIVVREQWPWLSEVLFASGFLGLFGIGFWFVNYDKPQAKAARTGYILAFLIAGLVAMPIVNLIHHGSLDAWALLSLPVVAGVVTAVATYAVVHSSPVAPGEAPPSIS